jgi:hypothetical protein
LTVPPLPQRRARGPRFLRAQQSQSWQVPLSLDFRRFELTRTAAAREIARSLVQADSELPEDFKKSLTWMVIACESLVSFSASETDLTMLCICSHRDLLQIIVNLEPRCSRSNLRLYRFDRRTRTLNLKTKRRVTIEIIQ